MARRKAYAFRVRQWYSATWWMSLEQKAQYLDDACDAALSGDRRRELRYDFLRPWREYVGSRQPVPKAVQAAVFSRDGRQCRWCQSSERLQLDHIKPWSQGGEHSVDNLRVLCAQCNSRRYHEGLA